jgi:alkaline phosphatase D
MGLIPVLLFLLTACGSTLSLPADAPAGLPNGVAAGDVDQTSAVLWARADVAGPVTFTLGIRDTSETFVYTASALAPLQPVTVTATGLSPGTEYAYRVEAVEGESWQGRFRTPAPPDVFSGLRFGASGDWRGSLTPYMALRNAASRNLDFFVAMGDTVYADLASPAVPKPRAESLEEFQKKQAEVYATRFGLSPLAELRASTATFATIDDHEVLNDFAGGADVAQDDRFPETSGRINQSALYRNALAAFQAYNPLRQEVYAGTGDARVDGVPKLYRYRTYGRDAAIFVTDARSFRDLPVRRADRNDPEDVARFRRDTFRPERTMLGAPQLADLKTDLLEAQAQGITWKFIFLPQPIMHRGLMSAQDRYEGYAAERTELLRFVEENGITNVVFVAADIHSTLVNNITYSEGPASPQVPTSMFEITVGPVGYDPTLGPIVITDGVNQGYVTPEEAAQYAPLPVAPDADAEPGDKDDFSRAILDRELIADGLDPVGLEGAPIAATLLEGDYVALHTYGWSEFEIDAATQQLTVTTYGIEPYNEDDLAAAPWRIALRQPEVMSRFEVMPQ